METLGPQEVRKSVRPLVELPVGEGAAGGRHDHGGLFAPLGGVDSRIHRINPTTVRITHVELRRFELPLVSPFRSSNGTETARRGFLVHVMGPDAEGWGECVAEETPRYSSEYSDGAHEVILRFLLPLLDPNNVQAVALAERFAPVRGHRMAKAAVEAAVLDAECRMQGVSLATRLGATHDHVPAGVAVGLQPSTRQLIDVVSDYVKQGYRRVKLKIEPGNDIEVVRAVREHFGEGLALQVDANQAYSLADASHLARLDPFGLQLIEQPLPEEDRSGHARLAQRIATPVCLDETITSALDAEECIAMGACSVVNVKPSRVGGLLEAVRIRDVCVAAGVDLWCGGMLETGIGRAANVALAALDGFTLPGDISASDRYFVDDLAEPFVLDNGSVRVPSGAGIGRVPLLEARKHLFVERTEVSLADL